MKLNTSSRQVVVASNFRNSVIKVTMNYALPGPNSVASEDHRHEQMRGEVPPGDLVR